MPHPALPTPAEMARRAADADAWPRRAEQAAELARSEADTDR